jgi:hypothetical protein
MALLLHCLREVRTRTRELDMLPPAPSADSCNLRPRRRRHDDPDAAMSRRSASRVAAPGALPSPWPRS